MEALQIRPARLNDIDGIREVAVETWNSTYETIYPEHFIATFLNHAYSKSSLEHSITRDEADPARKFLVAELAGEIVGFGQLSDPVNGESELTRLYILKEHQRKGIGKALLGELIRLNASLKEIFAWCERENGIGTLFYKSNGFAFTEESEKVEFSYRMTLAKYVKKI
ncbi:GNAT family N-acetyltransferase [Paenibacillus sp. FSL R5-0527]|uniref:GNAT family N-acetyltransferase n=1 Tax=Paenibacillus TaxID=44249 RepID=UPI00097AFE4B|nr:GNAT family N-acetyltransferase [Paenibacillus macerans]MED4958157.1 GNAT family N-acetyltransferase [Paenibacillus macerans]OMG46825.1 GNAT family N-acetyltransferase [Paenibacillus macerans]